MSNSRKLSHLSDQDFEELISMYYSGAPLNDLKARFNLPANVRNLPALFPPKTLSEICQYCNTPMIGVYASRSGNTAHFQSIYCANCGHRNSNYCTCNNCVHYRELNKQTQLREKQDMIKQIIIPQAVDTEELESLNLKQKSILGALLRDGSTEDFKLILPINAGTYKLSPVPEYDYELINYLSQDSNCLTISPDSNPNSIENIDLDAKSYSYYPKDVTWILKVESAYGFSKSEIIDELINPEEIFDFNLNEAIALWIEVAMYECIEYLNHTTESCFKVSYKAGDKTELTIKELLKTLSVSQIFGVIYKATNEALRFHAEKKVTKQHAINSIIGNCRSYSERAQANGWVLQKYHRIKDLPQSSISKFLYERVLKVGDNGFYHAPLAELIKFTATPKSDLDPDDELPF